MPYEGEFAGYRALQRVAETERVKQLLRRAKKYIPDTSLPDSLTADPDRSAMVNQDPYGEGWLVKIRMSNPEEVKNLLDAKGYQSFLEEAAD